MLSAERKKLIADKNRNILRSNEVPCNPGVLLGHKVAIEAYLRAMVYKADSISCYSSNCNWAIHSYFLFNELLPLGSPSIRVIPHTSGMGPVNTMGFQTFATMESKNMFSDGVVKNWDGTTSKVVLHINMYKELVQIYSMRTKKYISEYIKAKN